MKLTRRDFIKNNAIAVTAAAAGVTIPGVQQALAAGGADIRWDKAPCRFCGTGCSVLVGVKDGRMVASQGDPDAPVNRGLNCIKGYFLSKIPYGKDRLTQPLLRKKNGRFDKDGEFEPVSWDEAFDIMAEKWKAALAKDLETNQGKPAEEVVSSVGMFGSGQWTVFEGYAAANRGISLLTETWARIGAPEVRVNELMLGFVESRHGRGTRGWGLLSGDQKQALIDHTLMARTGTIADVVKAVLFMLKDAPFMTGTVLRLDGGYVLGGDRVAAMPPGVL